MSRKFVICADDNLSVQHQDAVTSFLRSQNVGFWHWFPKCWLIIDLTNTWTVESIRNLVAQVTSGQCHYMVLKIEDKSTWAAYGHLERFEWFRTNWDNQ